MTNYQDLIDRLEAGYTKPLSTPPEFAEAAAAIRELASPRTVACLTALAHIPTEELESGRLQNLVLRCVDAEKQRDDLLAALEYCKAIGDWTELHKHVNAAIASVRSSDRESNSKGGAA